MILIVAISSPRSVKANDDNPAAARTPEQHETLLADRVSPIREGERELVLKGTRRLLEAHSVLVEVAARLVSVPFETKRHSVWLVEMFVHPPNANSIVSVSCKSSQKLAGVCNCFRPSNDRRP